jgi:hypothetical protein
MHFVCTVVFVIALTVGGLKHASAQGDVTVPTLDEVLQAIGFSAKDKQALLAGKIISKDLKQVQEKEIVAAAAMRLPVPLSKIEDIYGHGGGVKADPDNIGFGILKTPFDESDWENVGFNPAEKDEINRIISAKPGSDLNLSAQEFATLRETLGGVKADQPEAAVAVSKAYRNILIGRFNSYLEKGLNGIAPYDRGSGKTSSPADEIRAAWEVENHFMEGHFPTFVRAFSAYPESQPPEISHEIHWRKQRVEGRPAFILEHSRLQTGENYILATNIQFFVGHTYNSQVVVWLLLPYEGDTLVFAANSTSTDAIAGLFSGIASSVGQDRMKAEIKSYFESARKLAK